MWSRAKNRALKAGIPFTIKPEDIHIPKYCPVLGIKLERAGQSGGHHASPSLDRIVPATGYVKSNIQVISHRANCIKNDASPDELRRVLYWLERVI